MTNFTHLLPFQVMIPANLCTVCTSLQFADMWLMAIFIQFYTVP